MRHEIAHVSSALSVRLSHAERDTILAMAWLAYAERDTFSVHAEREEVLEVSGIAHAKRGMKMSTLSVEESQAEAYDLFALSVTTLSPR